MPDSSTVVADIEITVAQQDAASRTLAVSVPVERVRAAEQVAVRWYGRQAKVPEPVVRRRFGDAIRKTVIEDLLRQSWEKARSEQSLKPVGDPQVRNLKFGDGAPLTFELAVDVRPELTLERLGGFRVSRQVAPVTDEMVDGQILALRETTSGS